MVNVYTVVGECREDPWRLLVVDIEGDYYHYLPAQERFTRVVADRVSSDYRRSGDADVVDAETERDPMPLAVDW